MLWAFVATAFAAVFLLPFVWGDLASVFVDRAALWLLIVTSLIVLGAALSDFEALRVGKLSVVEPVYALEVPVTTAYFWPLSPPSAWARSTSYSAWELAKQAPC